MERMVRRRIHLITILFVVISILLFYRLMTLHFSTRINLKDEADAQVRRGEIHSSDGCVLAMSLESRSLFANPSEIRNPGEMAAVLAPVLETPRDVLARRLTGNRRFVWIRRHMDDSLADRIDEMKLKGLYFRREYRRYYPYRELAAHVLGFVGKDSRGLEGMEYRCNDMLTTAEKDLPGRFPTGNRVILTINSGIQDIAEKELAAAMERHDARQGAVLVMEVKTGRILALAKKPSFDPNHYGKYPRDYLRLFSVIDSFEPGSTMKIITTEALMSHRPDALRYRYTCGGSVRIADIVINCTSTHGTIDIGDIIRYSCNAGIITAVRNLPKEKFYSTLVNCGFGSSTDSGLPGESAGILRPPDQWSGLSKYSHAIGHEMSVTTLQMAYAFSAIGNRGRGMKPAIIERVETDNGTPVQEFSPVSRGQVIPESHVASLLGYMTGVVRGGTGSLAASAWYTVAGKTGTSKKFSTGQGAYSDQVISSFVGLVPAEDPALCILIVVDDPADRMSGGTAAAPVFSRIADRSMAMLGIRLKEGSISSKGLKHAAAAGFRGPVPDFRGMSPGEAMVLVSKMQRQRPDMEVVITGSGRITSQSPPPGTGMEKTGRLVLVCGSQ